MTVKSTISLADERYAFAKTLVEAGRFPSMSAVMRQGVELLRQQMETEAMERAALAELLKQRRAGEFISSDKMDGLLWIVSGCSVLILKRAVSSSPNGRR
jgi:antitoxin ParD1/3/4